MGPRRWRTWHALRSGRSSRLHPLAGLRRALHDPDSPDWKSFSKGTQQPPRRRERRCWQSVGHRQRGWRPHRDPSTARFVRRFRAASTAGRECRYRIGPRPRGAVLARPSVGEGTPGVVSSSGRRHDPIRGKPTQEISGHRPLRLPVRAVAAALGGGSQAWCGSGWRKGCGSFASTTRTPSRSPSGSG